MPSIIHQSPRPFSSLPHHAALDDAGPSGERPDLRAFLHAALTEAQTFLDVSIPHSFKASSKARASPPSSAKVQLFTRLVRATDQDPDQAGPPRRDEFWVCRRSVHVDSAREDGTASWDEFRAGLRDNHSENEMDYTPSLTAVLSLLEWPVQADVDGWKHVDMHGTVAAPAAAVAAKASTLFILPPC